MDFPTRQELIAATHSLEEIAKYLRVDSVAYLSQEGMLAAMPNQQRKFCRACFSGDYPVDFSGRVEMSCRQVADKQISKKKVNL